MDGKETKATIVKPERRLLSEAEVCAYITDPQNVKWIPARGLLGLSNDACVDGRETEPIIATPGGDISLLTEVIIAIGKFTGRHFTPVEINKMFRWRLKRLGSFYMHTDEHALEKLKESVAADDRFKRKQFNSIKEVFQFVLNPGSRYQIALLDHLTTTENIGCGHLKLMLQNPEAYGMSRKVIFDLMSSFFDTLWNGSKEEKEKINYKYLRGSHNEGAVVTILIEGDKIASDTLIPAVRPTDGKTSMFIFHPQVAVYMHQQQVTALAESDLFPRLKGERLSAFLETASGVLGEGLRETVSRLAEGLPQYSFVLSH